MSVKFDVPGGVVTKMSSYRAKYIVFNSLLKTKLSNLTFQQFLNKNYS